MPQTSINWTRPKLDRFKKAYTKAKKDSFEFEGNIFRKAYAKYLIEYLEKRL